jgi:hypothetical protein
VSTINTLATAVLGRIEEANPPVFWQLQGEIYDFIVEGMNEAVMITGEPEVRQLVPFTLAANTTLFTVPAPLVALLRVQSPNWVVKTSLWDLDRITPGWESDVGTVPDSWFPYGLTQFGIHPQLNQAMQVFLTGIALPVPTGAPYTGSEAIPFQPEYNDGFEDYAAHIATLKEGGEEFKQSLKVYGRFLDGMTQLSNFAYRKGALRFSRVVGAPARVTPVEER